LKESDGMPAVKKIWLFQNSSKGIIRGVYNEAIEIGRVWESKNRGKLKGSFESNECSGMKVSSMEREILLSEKKQ
jgi:hypothetical protein